VSEEQCNHVIWLERIIPQLTDSPHWLSHDANDRDPPREIASENIVFNFCPMCGIKLDRD
jgi:hypothetical protein